MNYEEKYKQALENFKKIKSANSDNKELVNFIEYEYPELRESEDERIRKEIIELVHFFYGSSTIYEHHVPEANMISWLEKQGEHEHSWSEEEEKTRKAILELVKKSSAILSPMNQNSMIAWLESIKDRVLPKEVWSEEDERMVEDIIEAIDTQYAVSDYNEMVSWLKSLKPNHWKPSDEQMEALNAINNVGELSYVEQSDLLIKLYNDLEKL